MNVEARFRGRLEFPLAERGHEEALEVAKSLARVGLSAVYTSPLERAREVARAICAECGVFGYTALPGLLNLDCGSWHGLTREEAAERYPDAWRIYRGAPERARCPGGEALADAADRVIEALLALGERHPGESVAAVTHGVMVRLAALRSTRGQRGDWEIPLAAGSATAFEVANGRLSLLQATPTTGRIELVAP
jgi:broad specificity phosphatase PhoE